MTALLYPVETCLSCAREFHWECFFVGDQCCCSTKPKESEEANFSPALDTDNSTAPVKKKPQTKKAKKARVIKSASTRSITRPVGRPRKDDEAITVSAGRKRAAELYTAELRALEWCEWRNKANCGGGLVPILGCLAGRPRHIHHGPVKATYRNERKNISLICYECHVNWHNANDSIYIEDIYDALPMEPRDMTPEEVEQLIFEGRFKRE